MAPKKKTMGKGAVVSVPSSKLHPSEHIRNMYPNPPKNHRVEDMVVLRQEIKKINRRDQLAIVLRHQAFQVDGENIELHTTQRFCRVMVEGDPDFFFTSDEPREENPPEGLELLTEEIRDITNHDVINVNDIKMIQNLVEIDDDNKPAPENTPRAGDGPQPSVFGEWGHSGICHRRAGFAQNRLPTISFPHGVQPTLVQLFEVLFPKLFVQSVILPLINTEIGFGGPVEYWEFLRFVGLWFLIATIEGPERRDFWAVEPPTRYSGAPFRISEMSRNRFYEIVRCLHFTNGTPPAYIDRFFEICQLLDA